MELNLEAIKIFYEVAKLKNITKAAEKLYISQPAVTQAIKKLENELDITLFIRNKKGVELTRIGEEVYEKVESAMVTFESLEKTLKDNNQLINGELIVSCGTNIGKKVLVDAIEEFVCAYPKVNIIQTDDVQVQSIEKLRRGKIDLLITQFNTDIEGLEFKSLYKDSYVLVKSPQADFKNSDLRFIITGEGSYSSKIFSDFIENKNLKEFPIIRGAGYNIIKSLCKDRIGIGLLPRFLAEQEIKNKELEIVFNDYNFPISEYGVYYNKNNLTRAAKEFLKILLTLNT